MRAGRHDKAGGGYEVTSSDTSKFAYTCCALKQGYDSRSARIRDRMKER